MAHAAPVPPVVHIVDDDESARTATARMLRLAGYAVACHASAPEFLASSVRSCPGCVVLDVQMPGMSGLDLQSQFVDAPDSLPIIFLTGQGDIPMSVRAIQSGAVDFLTKPVQKLALLHAIGRAMSLDEELRATRAHLVELRSRFERLTPREREVFVHLIAGQMNKEVAFDLGTAERTVKAHRHNIMAKLGATSVADLVHIAHDLQIPPEKVR